MNYSQSHDQILVGGTGSIGEVLVEASAKASHPTFVLLRESTLSNPAKSEVLEGFKALGVHFLIGDLYDHESLVKAIKQVDVVFSTVGHAQLADQAKLISTIKEAGKVKEFGNDVDRVHAVEPEKSKFATKVNIRRAIEAEGIPYTYVAAHWFSGYFLTSLCQPGATAPPRDKVVILGDGNTKEAAAPINMYLSMVHSVFVKGDHTNFEIEPSFGVEATALYPDVKYTTVEEFVNQFV